MTVIGYARVSAREQPASQERDLAAAGAGRVFVDHGETSRVRDRPQWTACLEHLRAGDTLLVRALNRLAGTTSTAIETIADLHARGVDLKSLTEPDIDTTTTAGRALFGIVAVFAELPDDAVRGMTPERVTAAVRLRDAGSSTSATARVLGVSASSVSRALARFDGHRRTARR